MEMNQDNRTFELMREQLNQALKQIKYLENELEKVRQPVHEPDAIYGHDVFG